MFAPKTKVPIHTEVGGKKTQSFKLIEIKKGIKRGVGGGEKGKQRKRRGRGKDDIPSQTVQNLIKIRK